MGIWQRLETLLDAGIRACPGLRRAGHRRGRGRVTAAVAAAEVRASKWALFVSPGWAAYTVMAEGGVAAALANVDDRDNWRVHFADTMRGGQYLNNWRMAELHAKRSFRNA